MKIKLIKCEPYHMRTLPRSCAQLHLKAHYLHNVKNRTLREWGLMTLIDVRPCLDCEDGKKRARAVVVCKKCYRWPVKNGLCGVCSKRKKVKKD